MTAPQRRDLSRLGLRLPTGRSLPAEAWERRHRGALALLAVHAVGLVAFGLYMGARPLHALAEGGILAALAGIAAHPRLPRRARSVVSAIGLMTASGVLVHLSGGYIEAHFHFFVMLGVIFLYEDILPYVLAVAYVAVHHGVMGTLDPLSVFNHPSAITHPWLWAGIHAVFIAGLSLALLVAWNAIESARGSETRAVSQAEDLKRQLHSQEKMAALGSLVSGLAHEVRTPLTIIGANAGLLERAATAHPTNALAPRVLAGAHEIQDGVDRINALVLQLRKFHALAPDSMEVLPFDAVVGEAMRLFASANKGARVSLDLAPTPLARLHALGVHQVVLNLVTNAVEATDPATGIVTVRTRAEPAHAVLVVEDNGVGMSAEAAHKAFDPLFTTKKDGMGLGLHIVRRIVDAHGGSITCVSREGEGTTFEVRFPLAKSGRGIAVEPPPATRARAPSAAR